MGELIILNGPSSSGKSSIVSELQARWTRPLIATGIDQVISSWPQRFITGPGEDGSPAAPSTGIRIVEGRGPAPSWITSFGHDFHRLMLHAHRQWIELVDLGFDVVVDHVLVDDVIKRDALATFDAARWIGCRCDIDTLVLRESSRADRHVGFASGTDAVVHQDMTYDLEIDTSRFSAAEAAQLIAALLARRGEGSTRDLG